MDDIDRNFPLLVEDPALLAQIYDAYVRVVMEELLALLGAAPTQQ